MDRVSKVSQRANDRCEYCKMHQSLQGATFHVEHVTPRVRGGSSELDNLAWACPSCNLHKSDRVVVESANSDQQVPLFNPRTDSWSDHFEWDDYSILGTTEVGKVTVAALDLNHARRIKIRQAEQLFGLFPPDD